jgi:hypothetical protein
MDLSGLSLPYGGYQIEITKEKGIEALFKIAIRGEKESLEVNIPSPSYAKIMATTRHYLPLGAREEKGWGCDGMTVSGEYSPDDGETVDFEFWSPERKSAYSRFLNRTFVILKRHELPVKVTMYIEEIKKHYG